MDTDVLIAGLGPVGQLLANLLGARGVRVLAVDAAPGESGEPRSATTDDEVLRILQGVALDAAVAPHLAVQREVRFVAASGRALTLLEPPDPGPSGHPTLAAWHQPGVERVLLAGLARFASVRARWSARVTALAPEPDGVRVRLAGGEEVTARWVVGCDGARSPVRRLCGIGFGGSSFVQPWLVIDALVDAPVTDAVCFVGDPRRPAVSLPMAPGRHRWELMTSRAEDGSALLREPGAIPGRVERRAVYEFHARTADRWRAGRVLLAGDAAHVMPPFAGQGLAAGARDAGNLAWKLAAVLDGAPEALLDTYEAERRPDVRSATRVAILWGAVLQTRRARLARARDAALFALDPTCAGRWLRARARPERRLRHGVVHRPRTRGGGRLFPQPGRLDDALGDGWAVLGAVREDEAAAWRAVGARVVGADPRAAPWLARHGATWAALRPDRYVFAAGGPGDAVRAAESARIWLGRGR